MFINKKYSAFTLVEMLVVMGILVILMTMGIAAGRFAIQRANQVQHQNAVDQLYQGLQSYYADNRIYPDQATFVDWKTAMGTGGALAKYMDNKSFDGGSDATYFYAVDATGQSVLVCTTYGGFNDTNKLGGYCNGNGFGSLPLSGTTKVSKKSLDDSELNSQVISNSGGGAGAFIGENWVSTSKSWQ
ncbi:MAG TPA: type II secretion system protein [Candidatus Dojkabacteria bacterium]|nr:type II secretion system protein [Candidatus Dojkabacteria bacterium]